MKTLKQYIHHYITEEESTEFTHKHWKALVKFLNKKRNQATKNRQTMEKFFNKYLYNIGYCGFGFSSFPKVFNFRKSISNKISNKIKEKIEKYFTLMGGDLFTGYILNVKYWADYPEFWETDYYNRKGKWVDPEIIAVLKKLKNNEK